MMETRAGASLRFFMGGRDLEMITIRALLEDCGLGAQIEDLNLHWGARASAYAAAIGDALSRGQTPVLIELGDDLPPGFPREKLVIVDHHGALAGADKPSSLRQVFDLIAPFAQAQWTRHFAMVEANDIGHARALRAMGCSAGEIRAIRDADRAAQGVSADVEAESMRAISAMTQEGAIHFVETSASTSSAIMDFLLPEYGGPFGADEIANVLVAMPQTVSFFGLGAYIDALKNVQSCWYGGALPESGFWGAPRAKISPQDILDVLKDVKH